MLYTCTRNSDTERDYRTSLIYVIVCKKVSFHRNQIVNQIENRVRISDEYNDHLHGSVYTISNLYSWLYEFLWQVGKNHFSF